MTEGEITELKDLTRTYGWEILKTKLLTRKQASINSLVSLSDFNKIIREQERVREIDYLLNLPHELIRGGQNGNEQEIKGVV